MKRGHPSLVSPVDIGTNPTTNQNTVYDYVNQTEQYSSLHNSRSGMKIPDTLFILLNLRTSLLHELPLGQHSVNILVAMAPTHDYPVTSNVTCNM